MSLPSIVPWFHVDNRDPEPLFAGAGTVARPLFVANEANARAARPAMPVKAPASPPSRPASLRVVAEPADAEVEAVPPVETLQTSAVTAAPAAEDDAASPGDVAEAPAFLAAAARFEALHAEVMKSARAEVLELAIQIARRVVGDAVDRSEVDVTGLVAEAVARIGEGTRATVRVHPNQRSVIDRWLASAASDSVAVVFDESLAGGDVVVESADVSIDGRVATRMQRVEAAVRMSMEPR